MTFSTNENIIIPVTGTKSTLDYSLSYDGRVIFKGRAYSTSTSFQIDLTDIVLPLIERPQLPTTGQTATYTPKQFILSTDWTTASFTVLPWNVFDKVMPSSWDCCSHINHKVAADAPYLTGSYTSTNGSIEGVDVADRQTVGDNTVVCSDKPTLYWENQMGGYDSIILSEFKKTLSKTPYSYNSYGRGPSQIGRHHKRDYLNEGKISYKISTPYMNDEDSERFADIVMANRAWLWMNGKYYAVNVITTTLEQKKHKSDKMFSYSVDLELSEVIINY